MELQGRGHSSVNLISRASSPDVASGRKGPLSLRAVEPRVFQASGISSESPDFFAQPHCSEQERRYYVIGS
jgi:hypothetical protein